MTVAFSRSLDTPELHALPDKLLSQIIRNIESFPNETVDFRQPQLRPAFQKIYPLFLLLYGVLVVAGTVGNMAMVTHLIRRRRYREPVCTYLMNLGVCNLIMSMLLLPLSLAILLLQNWIFGSFLCYFVPMLQDTPLHATIATHLLISAERYLEIVCPLRPRPSAFITILGIWVTSICVVLPYFVYVHYVDLESLFGRQFRGVGICTVNMRDDIDDYTRVLFAIMYVLPLGIATFFHVRTTSELKRQEGPVSLAMMQAQGRPSQHDIWSLQDNTPGSSSLLTEVDGRDGFLSHGEGNTPSTPTIIAGGGGGAGGGAGGAGGGSRGGRSSIQMREESQMDVAREKRNQKYLICILTASALCLCPLMILRLVKNMVLETYHNTGHFDVTFISFVWVAFLPTVTTPAIFALWKMPRSTKDRLQGYLRLSSRRRRSDQAQNLAPIITTSNNRAAHRLSLDHTNPPIPGNPHAHHESRQSCPRRRYSSNTGPPAPAKPTGQGVPPLVSGLLFFFLSL
ncbi:LOW QUALITY PROTEIN: orexin/Hypocretin receptor type 1-like [Macrobrachium rosenbergii]|uniref:LOW QUALITY PROTEIN: orexin/Hypocretin receptor type 1-like n=1 Tax=Macrobrachium rosenbergii TaxID=79674 RepID=UPI0034D5B81F